MKYALMWVVMAGMLALLGGCGAPEEDSDGYERVLYGKVLDEEDGETCVAAKGYVIGTFTFKRSYYADDLDWIQLINKNLMTKVHPMETEVISQLEARGFARSTLEFEQCSFYVGPYDDIESGSGADAGQ